MNLISGSVSVLNDAKFYLQKISTSEYTQLIPLIFDSSIGTHTRHFIEFYQCLLAQAESENINYCLRKRDLDIEEHPEMAIKAIDEIITQLTTLNLDTPVILNTSKAGETSIKSTIGRELYYNIEHCIHHLALIKVGLKMVCPTMKLPDHFGFAPSTILHRKLEAQQ